MQNWPPRYLFNETKENNRKPRSGLSISGQRFEPQTLHIRSMRDNQWSRHSVAKNKHCVAYVINNTRNRDENNMIVLEKCGNGKRQPINLVASNVFVCTRQKHRSERADYRNT